jgi:hypothetical protein
MNLKIKVSFKYKEHIYRYILNRLLHYQNNIRFLFFCHITKTITVFSFNFLFVLISRPFKKFEPSIMNPTL